MASCEDRYRLMVEHASDVVFTADVDGHIDWISPSVGLLTGEPPDRLLGRHAAGFIVEDDLATAARVLDEVLGGRSVEFEGRVTRSAGPPTWVSAHVSPLRDDEGTIIGMVGTVRDVTDVVTTRAELTEALDAYRVLAEHMGDVVLRLSTDLVIQWVSPSVTRVLGHQMADLVGKPLGTIVPEQDLAEMTNERRSLEAAARQPDHPVIVQVRCADDSLRWVANRPSPVYGDDGALIGIVTTWSDVQDLVTAERVAQREHDQLRATLDTLLDPHVLLDAVRDADGKLVDFVHLEANQAACAFGRAVPEPLVGRLASEVLPPPVFEDALRLFGHVLDTGEPLSLDEHHTPLPDGTLDERCLDLRATKVGDAVSHTWRDSTERHAFEARLAHLATHDPLTGLANRASLNDELGRALSSAERSGKAVAALMLDLDHFKDVNDVFGHAAGDDLLIAASGRIGAAVRGGDLVARLGGDEFVVVMRDLEDSSEAVRVAMRILQAFRVPIPVEGNDLSITTSVGVAVSTGSSTVEALLHDADDALYRAKDEGRDRFALFNDDLRTAAGERVALEAQLRPALDLGELAVHYQPEIDLATGEVCAVEALLRWHHPSGELYPAAKFIDIAEEIGVIIESGNWVVSEACAQAARWADHGLVMRVNLSKQQLNEAGLVTAFQRSLEASGIAPSAVCAEVSETALMLTAVNVQRNLKALRELGVRLAIDNFGTGYAALAYLRDLDLLKIHHSFVHVLEQDEYARRLVGGIVALADRIGLRVAAEGVETMEQVRLLRELGCGSAQGFVFHPALSAAALEPLLGQRFDLLT